MTEPRNIQMLYFSLSFSSVLTHIFRTHVDSRENIVTRRALIFLFLGPNFSATAKKCVVGGRGLRHQGTLEPSLSLNGALFSIVGV